MIHRRHLLLPVFLFCFSFAIAQEKKPVQISDLTKIVTVSDPEITPDGQVIFVKNYMEAGKEGEYDYKSQVIRLSLSDPSQQQVLNSPSYDLSSFAISPDGKSLAFTKTWDGKPQIWILPLNGGEAQVLTSEKNGASSPVWSPDGS